MFRYWVCSDIGYVHTLGSDIGYVQTWGMYWHWLCFDIGYVQTSGTIRHLVYSEIGLFRQWVCSDIRYFQSTATFRHWVCSDIDNNQTIGILRHWVFYLENRCTMSGNLYICNSAVILTIPQMLPDNKMLIISTHTNCQATFLGLCLRSQKLWLTINCPSYLIKTIVR